MMAVFLKYFYPRSPCGERLTPANMGSKRQIFLSTLSLRRATAGKHAQQPKRPNFYPRSPCGERLSLLASTQTSPLFLSTLSLRRATNADCNYRSGHRYFYPRSPCGERPRVNSMLTLIQNFYPRSPCGERPTLLKVFSICSHFYPRSPCGERHDQGANSRKGQQISIHALLAESDQSKHCAR